MDAATETCAAVRNAITVMRVRANWCRQSRRNVRSVEMAKRDDGFRRLGLFDAAVVVEKRDEMIW